MPLIGHRLAQVPVGGAEAREHVHESPPAGLLLDLHDAVGGGKRVGQRQLDEDVLAGLHGPHGGLGMQPGG